MSPVISNTHINRVKLRLVVQVGVANKELPKELRQAISSTLEDQWKKDLAAGGGKWFLEDILDWAEAKYSDLLCSVPALINRYDTGFSEIRYNIQEPVEEEEEVPPCVLHMVNGFIQVNKT